MLGTFENQVQKAVLIPMAVVITAIIVISIALSDATRQNSLNISQSTVYDISLGEMQTRTQGVAQELDAQVKELTQQVRMAANLTDQQLPVVRRVSQRVWAQTNVEANIVPQVDGAGVALV